MTPTPRPLRRLFPSWPRGREALWFGLSALAVAVFQMRGLIQPQVAPNRDHEALTEYLQASIPTWMADYDIPGVSAALIVEGQTRWIKQFGYADLESRVPLSETTVLMGHSISKSLTAWGVMHLVEQGQLDLDAPVEPHLRGFRFPRSGFATEEITVRALLSNSSGLPLGRFGEHVPPGQALPKLGEVLANDPPRLVREPRTEFEYSNTGFAVLELLVESLTGRPFADYMDDEILRPLGMHQSSFRPTPSMLQGTATGYDLRGRPVPVYLYPYRASGGLFTTVGDMTRFVEASLRTHGGARTGAISPKSLRQMLTPQIPMRGLFSGVTDAYGLGHFLERLAGGRVAAWHGGQGLGWMTHFHLVPSTGDGIVVFTNSQRSWPFFARLLGVWSRSRGLGTVGMGRIVWAQAAFGTLVGWMLLTAVWSLGRVVSGVKSGRRRLCLRAGATPVVRAIQFVVGLVAFGTVGWAMTQDYLFVSSIFPAGAPWLWGALLVLGAAMWIAASVPVMVGQEAGRAR